MEQQPIKAMMKFDNHVFISNEQALNHQADKFVIDFKQIYPQFGPENQPTLMINHRVILLDPHVAKAFFNALQENIKRYEQAYGEIKLPDALKKQKKLVEKNQKGKTVSETSSYFG